MIRVTQLKIPVDSDTQNYIQDKLARLLHIPVSAILSYTPVKRAIDARKKNSLFFVYNFDVAVSGNEEKILSNCKSANVGLAPNRVPFALPQAKADIPPIVCGMGPAGLFCAYALAKAGLQPVLIERGKDVDARTADVAHFIKNRVLQPERCCRFF